MSWLGPAVALAARIPAMHLSRMTSPARELQLRLVQAMTAEQKLLASQALREWAWDLKTAWLRHQQPELSDADVQERVRQVFRDAGA